MFIEHHGVRLMAIVRVFCSSGFQQLFCVGASSIPRNHSSGISSPLRFSSVDFFLAKKRDFGGMLHFIPVPDMPGTGDNSEEVTRDDTIEDSVLGEDIIGDFDGVDVGVFFGENF